MPNPSAPIQRTGRRTISAITTMHQPKLQITDPCTQGTKPHAKSITVNSRSMSHKPRVRKKRETCCTDLPRLVARNAPRTCVPDPQEQLADTLGSPECDPGP